jgi:hypothetical protein
MGYRCTLSVSGMDSLREIVDPVRLSKDLEHIHRKLAFMSLEHAIRTCSVDTGRARAGFLALHTKHGISAANVMRRTPPGGAGGRPDPAAEAEGKAKSRLLVDRPFEIRLANTVNYVEFINSGTSRMRGTGFLDKTIQKTITHAQKVVDWYVTAKLSQVGLGKVKSDPSEGPGEIPT